MPQSPSLNRRLVLAARPQGEPTADTLRLETTALPPCITAPIATGAA